MKIIEAINKEIKHPAIKAITMTSEEWEIICEYIADKDHDTRDLAHFIRKGDITRDLAHFIRKGDIIRLIRRKK